MSVNCPHCKASLSLFQRRWITLKPVIECHFCNGLVSVKKVSGYINSAVLGVAASIASDFFPYIDMSIKFIVAIFLIILLQGFLDIFYSLESAEEELIV